MPPPIVAVFGASRTEPGDDLYEQGVECGRLLAASGYSVVTGGYEGLMEAVSKGAAGVRVIGVTAPAVFRNRSGVNEFVTEEHAAEGLADRIGRMTAMAAAAIVLPGSLGTLTELTTAWNLAYVCRFSGEKPKPLITVGREWADLIAGLTTLLDTDGGMVHCAPDVRAAVAELTKRLPA